MTRAGEIRVLVGATDYEASTAFYGELLGFPVEEAWDDPDGRGTLFRAGRGVIEVVADSSEHPAARPQGVTVAIEVDDADALHERLRGAGVRITSAIGDRPWGHRNFGALDPAGLPLVFFQQLTRSSSSLVS